MNTVRWLSFSGYLWAMKNSVKILLCCLILSLLVSCNSNENRDSNEKTLGLDERRDSLENLMIGNLEQINQNLDLIRQKQGLINSPNVEVPSLKERILQNISLINSLLDDNAKKIELLDRQVLDLGKNNKALSRLVKMTRERLQKQEQEILQLKQDLAFEEFKVADLNVMMDEMQVKNEQLESEKENLIEINAQYDKDLNKVYFVYGTETELREKEILNPRSLLHKSSLATTFNKNRSYFSEFDLRSLTEIPLNGKKAKLLTLHPEDSYRIEQSSADYCKIIISDAESFWSVSRFLVVQVN